MPKRRCNIYIATDLEGVSGVWRFAQTRDRASAAYAQAVEYLMGDIAAVVDGLRAAGATTITVLDEHGGGNNFLPHLFARGATYISGQPRRMLEGLDASYDGLILLGYHAMQGTADGVLHHTQSSENESRYWYNGRESGEIAQSALIAGQFGVPVIMVTGDTAACREARRFLGRAVVTVPTKRGISREAAELYPLEDTRRALYEGAQKAVQALPACKPYTVPMPIRCRRQWLEPADPPGTTRTMTRTAVVDDVFQIFTF